ncbi:unnamed protein product, partial [Linum tenue]
MDLLLLIPSLPSTVTRQLTWIWSQSLRLLWILSKCEAIPCDQFEVAFQAVELWIADRAVLPVENSLGGSIHRNYD